MIKKPYEKSIVKAEQAFGKINRRFDRVEVGLAEIKEELFSFEKRVEDMFTNFANRLYSRIDPLIKEIEDARVDREFTTQKFSDLENRIESLEKAVN